MEAINLDNLSFEQALMKLEEIVKRLEDGKCPLDEAVSTFELGVKLKDYCANKLNQAKIKIEKINLSSEGVAEKEIINNFN